MKLDIDSNKELFRWGPSPLRYFYQSDFNIMMGGGPFEKVYPQYMWPPSISFYIDHKVLWVNEFEPVRNNGGRAFGEIFLTEKFKEIKKKYDEKLGNLNKLEDSIEKTDLSKLTESELKDLWNKFHESIIEFITYGLIPELCNYGADKYLENKLVKHLGENHEAIPNIMETIAAPEETSFYQKEEIELSETDNIEEHQRKYFWIKNSYFEAQVVPISFFQNRKKELANNLRKKEEERIAKVKENKSNLKNKHDLSDEIMSVGRAVAYDIVWQDDRKEHILQYIHFKDLLLNEIVKRKNLSNDEMLNFTYDEILEIFDGKDYSKKIEDRKKGFAEYITNKREMLGSKEAREYYDLFLKEKIIGIEKEIKGIIASKGKVQGRVRILLDPKNVELMKKGEILVAPMTSPEYIFAMRLSAAIVTDSGGLTSHAAIVSRELQVPCIVGSKIATQVLKDGDLVEVDADKGIVRILK